MWRFALLIAALPVLSAAQDWQQLNGDAALNALQGRKLVYESGAWQEFRASGRTLYNAGQDSWGYWAIRDAQYCSSWPPSDLWACYDLAKQGNRIKFTGAAGDETIGTYAN